MNEARHALLLRVCEIISKVTQVLGGVSAFMNLMMIFQFEMPIAEFALRCYGIAFGGVIILAEREVSWLMSYMAFMESWFIRGFCLSFFGLLNILFDHAGATINMWRHVVGVSLIAIGALYTALGMVCSKELKNLSVRRSKRQKAMKEEVNHLTAQKMEIERLLADTENKLQNL